MPRRKVRHAMVSWNDGNGHQLSAFRGQTVEMPQDEIDRLTPFGALIPEDEDLERPGILMELPQAPDDEELVAWLLSASPDEAAALARERPELVPRLEGARQHVVDERGRQDAHLEEVRKALANAPSQSIQTRPAPQSMGASLGEEGDTDIVMGFPPRPATGGATDDLATRTPTDAPVPETPASAPAASSSIDEAQRVVQGHVDDIVAYLAEHPDQAEAVLEAETVARNGQPRAGVTRAVQTAASFVGAEA